jgi:alkyl sulfatase BDS1-like metallo-beta-lactamase superfamily hydrolase
MLKTSRITLSLIIIAVSFISSAVASQVFAENKDSTENIPKDATSYTAESNKAVLSDLPFENKQDFEDAQKGFIAPLPDNGIIKKSDGTVVWNLSKFTFANNAEVPDTVNPSLWRQMQLLNYNGLFKVTDSIYQIRSADLANMTIVEGKEGIIIIDPLMSAETAKAALNLYFQHRPKKDIVAVIFSHTHIDHYAGVKGVISEEDVASGKVKVIAPEGFTHAVLSENVMTGNAMSRRALYQYGSILPPGPKGMVGTGLGISVPSFSTITFIPPTHTITKTGQEMVLGGEKFVFQLVPETEAPAEMHFYIPSLKALSTAENGCHNMHNIYTLRGAKIRDAYAWSKALNGALDLWGDEAVVLYGMHHWPVWGNERINEYLTKIADSYKYMNDQTLHLANQGYTPVEIGEMLQLPDELAKNWPMRGYYGTLNHNVKSIYVHHLGWYDGNPANLHKLPPISAGKKYIEFMGGTDAIIAKAKADYDKGEYRWVAEVLSHVVYADPENQQARDIAADAMEQMGYQTESGTWRNWYLTGAKELRHGVTKYKHTASASPDTIKSMPVGMIFDYLAIRLNPEKAKGKNITINMVLPDTKEQYVLVLRNSVLNYKSDKQAADPDVSIKLNRPALNDYMLKNTTLEKQIQDGDVVIEGDKDKFDELMACMDTFNFWFNLVESQGN